MNPIEQIQDMETRLNGITEATESLKVQLDRMKALREQTLTLFQYYGSEDWYSDREADLPANLPAGVLSEDLIYDSITDLRDAAFEMLELSTDILKNWI